MKILILALFFSMTAWAETPNQKGKKFLLSICKIDHTKMKAQDRIRFLAWKAVNCPEEEEDEE